MYGDRAVLIPLIPTRYTGSGGPEDEVASRFEMYGANIISNDGAKTFFHPLTLPLFGNYDSYGRLDDIEEDENTRCIEKFFKMKIKDFAEAVAVGERFEMPKGWQKYNNKWLKNIAGMFVHRDIWDHMATETYDEFGKPNRAIYDDGDLTDEVLSMVGFRFEKEDKSFDQRYNRLLTRKDMPEVQVWSDGTWIRTVIKGKKYESIYDLERFIETIEKHSEYRFPPAQLRRVKSTSKFSPIIESSLKAREASRKEILEYTKLLREAKKKKDTKLVDVYSQIISYGGLSGFAHGYVFTLGDHLNRTAKDLFEAIYGKSLKQIAPLLMKHRQVEESIFAVNRLYMPSTNGYQHGNHYQSRALYAKSLEIVEAKIKEKDEDD